MKNGVAENDFIEYLVFTVRLAKMFEAGVAFVPQLDSLTDLPGPIGAVVPDIRDQIAKGHTLSSTLNDHPEIFPKYYVALIRAGEVGGVLDVILGRIAAHIAFQLRLVRTLNRATDHNGRLYAEIDRLATLIMFSETLSVMLASGVPVLFSMQDAVALLQPNEAELFRKAIENVKSGKPLADPLHGGTFPGFWLAMVDAGERAGTLDINLHLAAEALSAELDALVQ